MGDSPYGRILIPVDGSEDALRVIRPAGELARVMEASVDFLYVSPFDESTDEGDASWLPASIVRPAAEDGHTSGCHQRAQAFTRERSAARECDADCLGTCTCMCPRGRK